MSGAVGSIGRIPTPRYPKPNEMPEPSASHGKTFAENLDILFDELSLATKWGRPSILLAVHKSRFGQDKAEKALEARLTQIGQSVARIVVSEGQADVARQIMSTAPQNRSIFFISNLDWGGGQDGMDAYRALNLQREHFIEQGVRAVFWLTSAEATHLPRYAPDFWAFRHRVIEFVSQRAPGKIRLPAGALAWDVQKSVDPFESLEAGIRAREELLARLPRSLEALSTRVELHHSLGYLHWTAGKTQEAAQAFEAGLALAADHELPELKSRLLNGLGILGYESGEYAEALERFELGLRQLSSSPTLLLNLAACCCMLGRNQEAQATSKKALRSNPADADSWSRVGYLYNAMGKPDEAITAFRKAVELAPRSAAHHEALAVLYGMMEHPEDARHELEAAANLAGQSARTYLGILHEAILGDAETAWKLVEAAVATAQLARHQVRRDPNLALLFEAAHIEALSS